MLILYFSAHQRVLFCKNFRFGVNSQYAVAFVDLGKHIKAAEEDRLMDPAYFPFANGTLKQDFSNIYANIVAKTYSADDSKTLFNKTLDACKFTKQLSGNVLFKSILGDIEKNANFKVRCPFKKGYYEIRERKFKILIVPVIFGKVKFSVVFSVLSKISGVVTKIFDTSAECEIKDS